MKYVVHVDSRDRDRSAYPNANYYRLHVPQNIRYVTSAQVLSAEVPFSFYSFATARNNVTLTTTLNGNTANVTIPDGNYTGSTISAAVQTLLANAFPTRAFTCSANATTLRFSVTSNVSNDTIGIVANTATQKSSLAYRLGFPEGVTTTGGNTGTVIGTYPVSLSPDTYVTLCIDELASSASLQSASGGIQMSAKAPIAKLQIQGQPFAYNFIGNGSEQQGMATVQLNPTIAVLHHVTASLRFHDGSLVNLSNADEYSFSMLLNTDSDIQRQETSGVTRIRQ